MERAARKSGPSDGSWDSALPPCPGPSHWTGVQLHVRVLSWPAHPTPAPAPHPAGLTSDAQIQPWLKASVPSLGLPWPPVRPLGRLPLQPARLPSTLLTRGPRDAAPPAGMPARSLLSPSHSNRFCERLSLQPAGRGPCIHLGVGATRAPAQAVCPTVLCTPSGPVTPLCPVCAQEGEGCSHGAPMPVGSDPSGRPLMVGGPPRAGVGMDQASATPAPPQVRPPGHPGAWTRAAMMVWTWRMPARSGSPSWPSSSSLWSTAASSPSSRQVARAGGALHPGPGFLRKPPLPTQPWSRTGARTRSPGPQGGGGPSSAGQGPRTWGPRPLPDPGALAAGEVALERRHQAPHRQNLASTPPAAPRGQRSPRWTPPCGPTLCPPQSPAPSPRRTSWCREGAPGWPCSPRAGGPGCSPLASPPTIRHIKSFDPSSCLLFLCPSPQILQVRAPRRPRAHTEVCPHTQERWAGSGTQQGAASRRRCRAYCSKGTGHTRHVRPHLHTRVHTHADTCPWAHMRRSASTHTCTHMDSLS